MKRALMLAGTLSLMVGLAASPASAQLAVDRFDRQLELIEREAQAQIEAGVPVDQRTFLDFGAYLTFYYFGIDNVQQDMDDLRLTELNGYVRMNVDDVHKIFVRVRTAYEDWNAGESPGPHGDDWTEPQLDRATYTLDVDRMFDVYGGQNVDYDLTIRLGRQLVVWANGLAFSEEIDGVFTDFRLGKFGFTGFAGHSIPSSTDFDSSRADFNTDTKRAFFGGMLSYQITPQHRPYVYGLVNVDLNTEAVRDSTFGLDQRFQYDSFYIGVGSKGNITENLLYQVEFVYEGGETYSTSFQLDDDGILSIVDQTKDDISAFAGDIQFDYLLGDEHNTRFTLELIFASGDDDRLFSSTTAGGNAPNTTDNAFNGFGLLNTGLAFNPEYSNLFVARFGVSMFPFPTQPLFRKLQVGTNMFIFNKFDSDAPIDEFTDDEFFLGFETDFFANWQVTSDFGIGFRYGIFFPGSAIGPEGFDNLADEPRQFVMGSATLSF